MPTARIDLPAGSYTGDFPGTVDDLVAGTIEQTDPSVGDTLTVTGSNVPSNGTILWEVDTGSGYGDAGGTNDEASYDTTGQPEGDYRRGVSTPDQSMVYTPAVTLTSGVFTPAALFASSEEGAWYDPSDLSTMYTDDGITNVTTDGQAVYRIDDKSGNGRHLRQAVSASRPTYRTSGGLHWLDFDGGDSMSTSAIDFSGTDKMTFAAAVNKEGGSFRMLAELSANSSSNAGSFFIAAPVDTSNYYRALSRGTATLDVGQASTFTAAGASPDLAVITATMDISGDATIIRRNGTAASTGTGDQGSGNFGNYALYVGAQGGSSLYYDGRLYGMVIRGAASSGTEIDDLEAWLADKNGVTL